MAVTDPAYWRGQVAERLDDLEDSEQDHEGRLRSLETKVTMMLAKWGVVVAIILLAASLVGSYFGAHGIH